jgi:maltose alpha-D-glucosyltransferase/alpha-amylase
VIVVNNLSGEKLETSLTLLDDLVEKIGKTTGMVNLINREKINVCLKCEKLIVSLEPYQTLCLSQSQNSLS